MFIIMNINILQICPVLFTFIWLSTFVFCRLCVIFPLFQVSENVLILWTNKHFIHVGSLRDRSFFFFFNLLKKQNWWALTWRTEIGTPFADLQMQKHYCIWKNNIRSSFKEARNLVLGIAANSFNPWDLRSATYSITHVLIVIYNLPMELATKNAFILLTFIIPGKHQVKNMDIFLATFGRWP